MSAPQLVKLGVAKPKGRQDPKTLAMMKEIWNSVPKVHCKGLCQDQCTQVPIMPIEALYLTRKHDAWIHMSNHRGRYMPTLGHNEPCQFLKDGRCSVYDDRPLICRMFGHEIPPIENIRPLECEHGCTHEGTFTEKDFLFLTSSLMMLSMGLKFTEVATNEEIYPLFLRHVASLPLRAKLDDGSETRVHAEWNFDDE
jgi:uncharacterized protein